MPARGLCGFLRYERGWADSWGRIHALGKLRHREPPQGYSSEEWWAAAKLVRIALYRPLPFQDKANRSFWYALPDLVLKMLHEVDRELVSRLRGSEQIANPHTRDTYVINSFIEEAITSSPLEGASTTRGVAKQMLREGRRPRTISEQMIANNYQAMRFIREHAKECMTPALIMEIHDILMMQTLDDSTAARRLRRHEDDIHVVDNRDGRIIHTPPAAEELPERLEEGPTTKDFLVVQSEGARQVRRTLKHV